MKQVMEFTYLGSVIHSGQSAKADITGSIKQEPQKYSEVKTVLPEHEDKAIK